VILGAVGLAASGLAAQDRIEPDQPYAAIARQGARVGAPRWRLPLGAVRVDHLQPIGTDYLLVGLRRDEIRLRNLEFLLVRRDDGSVVWRHERDDNGNSIVLAVGDDAVLFQTVEGEKTELVTVALADGKKRWDRSYKGDVVAARPAPWAARVFVERRDDKKVEFVGVRWSDGRELWKTRSEIPKGAWRHAPVVTPEAVLTFVNGTTAVDPEDGQARWSRPDLAPDSAGAPVQLDATTAFVTVGAAVEAVALADGATRWRADLPAYAAITNVLPDSGAVYVRGIVQRDVAGGVRGNGIFLLSVLDPTDGTVRWQRRTVRPTLSNVVVVQDGLFVAGVDRLYAFDAANGDFRFDVETGAVRPYPIRLRAYPDRVGFIGEHVLAAFDPVSGDRLSWVGTTPLSQATTLAGLDAQIPRLRAQVAALGSGNQGGGFSYAGYASMEAHRYQNLANKYSRDYWSASSSGNALGAQWAANRQREASSAAKTMSKVAFAMSIFELAAAFQQGAAQSEVARAEGMLERQLMFRESVLSGNAGAETGDWVYRPNMVFLGGEDFATVALLNLATGRRRTQVVSPNYLDHGLWSVLDPERGVIYQAGIGLDTAAYTWSDSHSSWPEGKVQTIELFLLATPVRLPE
jgi:outer membrane protein assembly factor BamB